LAGAKYVLRVFHIPSHLSYVQQLVGSGFAPVASPPGGPLRIGQLCALPSWDWFDILHLHSVELCTLRELQALIDRTREEHKPLVMTVHDLRPNIELDDTGYRSKLALTLAAADAGLTLTATARRELIARGLGDEQLKIAPHGSAFPLPLFAKSCPEIGHGIAAFGALRTNRNFGCLAQAWQLLPKDGRPPLRIWLRSVSADDENRYSDHLRILRTIAATEPGFDLLVVPGFIEPASLLGWLRQSRVLMLPYRSITHSGQLEAAIDSGLTLLAPDIPTLRDQVKMGPEPRWPVTWMPSGALGDLSKLAAALSHALDQPRSTKVHNLHFGPARRRELAAIVGTHKGLYSAAYAMRLE
jgi:hypothetical protein